MAFSVRKWHLLAIILVIVTLMSVAIYESSLNPNLHFDFVSQQQLSSVIGHNFTVAGTGSSSGFNISDFPGANSVNGITYDMVYSNESLSIGVARFNDSAAGSGWFWNRTSSLLHSPDAFVNETYRGFTYTYLFNPLESNISVRPISVYGFDRNFVMIMQGSMAISNASTVKLIHDQMGAML